MQEMASSSCEVRFQLLALDTPEGGREGGGGGGTKAGREGGREGVNMQWSHMEGGEAVVSHVSIKLH